MKNLWNIPTTDFTLRRTIPAAPAVVFDAWLNPNHPPLEPLARRVPRLSPRVSPLRPAWMGGHRVPPEGDPATVLSFSLIWLDDLRRREPRIAVEGLALYVSGGRECACARRLPGFDSLRRPLRALRLHRRRFRHRADPRDHGNLGTRLDP